MAHTSGSIDRLVDVLPHERNFWRVWLHIRRFRMLGHQAEKELHSQQEAQMITFREEHLMRRMLFRFGRATGALPPELVETSDEDELAHLYLNDVDSDSDSDSDTNSEPNIDVWLRQAPVGPWKGNEADFGACYVCPPMGNVVGHQ